jgi:NAD(P)-dependent dehydrogenase (short-subunit alcohol dehydrogenase family)
MMSETKALVVTGGAGGIGAAVAKLAASRGYLVIIDCLPFEEDAAIAVKESILKVGGRAEHFLADVTCEEQVDSLFSRATLEGRQLAGVVNCAGIDCRKTSVAEVTFDEVDLLFTVNVVGTILTSKAGIRRMARSQGGQGGAIVNVSSMAATIGGRSGSVAYAATKAAVDAFTVGLAKEVAREGIRVNAVRPGMTATSMTTALADTPSKRLDVASTIPIGRMATVVEIAGPIMWLFSPEASFVSGCCLDVSGGGFLVGADRTISSTD